MDNFSANNMKTEQVDRLVQKYAHQQKLSKAAQYELQLAVKENPNNFINDEEEQAFAEYMQTIQTYQTEISKEIESDKDFFSNRMNLINMLHSKLTALNEKPALLHTSINLEAQRILAQLSNDHPAAILDELLSLKKEFDPLSRSQLIKAIATYGDAWTCASARPLLRLYAQIAQTALDCACFKLAEKTCRDLLSLSPSDLLGARFTLALTLSRLEDENGLNELDEQSGYRTNAWMRLAFTVLFFKLNRMSAAKRALKGFTSLGEGAAYALLRPSFVDLYIPTRVDFKPDSFAENVIAVHEAETIIADIPEFIPWVESIPEITENAKKYAFKAGLDWWEENEE